MKELQKLNKSNTSHKNNVVIGDIQYRQELVHSCRYFLGDIFLQPPRNYRQESVQYRRENIANNDIILAKYFVAGV